VCALRWNVRAGFVDLIVSSISESESAFDGPALVVGGAGKGIYAIELADDEDAKPICTLNMGTLLG
jgi:hypothetical protein